MAAELGAPHRRRSYVPDLLRSRRFVAVILAIGGTQLMASMDGPVVVLALPTIQNELGLSDGMRSWVITAYVLTFGGLMLVGGRLGDTIGRKRTFIFGVVLFTIASGLCAIAWNGGVLVLARLVHGAAAAIIAPTCMALVATTFPKGPVRNAATAVLGGMIGVGSVMGLVLGGMLTDVSWRLVFWVNVPIGILVICLGSTMLQETQKERMRLDASGAVLATLICTAAVFGLSMGPEMGWVSALTIGSGVVTLVGLLAFVVVERTAENPVVPFSLFFDRNRLATYAVMFLSGGTGFTLAVLIALYVQDVMGYSALQAGISFIPFALAQATGMGASSQLVKWFPPRVVVIAGASLLLGAMLYGSTLNRGVPYFPDLMMPLVVGGLGLGMMEIPLMLSLIASVGSDRIGPASAVAVMIRMIGGPVVLVVIQAVITLRTLHLGGTTGPVVSMNDAQLDALDNGFTDGLLGIGVVVLLLAAVALFIGYTAEQVARAKEAKEARDAADAA
ncbi:MFS transporter [Mycolicibacterium celeriflavum]|uniref:MFS transporter n=2 Tax=Mycolicibacterium celeriflavum TaxID=1249101 RepID=A0A1X0BKW0_MYCCF|nr:MFS transporter [Mycolicibacterium celeriflavum]MCV7236489.1 MFS transporter [Mycolicibacterium celeriflavum]ORA42539.1 MFS transporter [Mycolicibacterium celeriflavum]BBY45789.1 MFS transporter [Mycolicibacterium celeriflavum]